MRKIIVSEFLSLDGIIQGPGGPHEDTSGNFKYGGWTAPINDDVMNDHFGKLFSHPYDLLLGHFTYDIFAAHWPYKDDTTAQLFNAATKYVVATTPVDLSWKNSVLITGEAIAELKKLKASAGRDLFVWGSGKLVQTLLAAQMVDVLHTWTYPLMLGSGKRLFVDGIGANEWRITDSLVSPSGVLCASYEPVGEIRTGIAGDGKDEPSEKEIIRRARLRDDD